MGPPKVTLPMRGVEYDDRAAGRPLEPARWAGGTRRPGPLAAMCLVVLPVVACDMGVDSHHVVYPQAVKTMTNQVRRHRAAWS
jgi:hypothetical protein